MWYSLYIVQYLFLNNHEKDASGNNMLPRASRLGVSTWLCLQQNPHRVVCCGLICGKTVASKQPFLYCLSCFLYMKEPCSKEWLCASDPPALGLGLVSQLCMHHHAQVCNPGDRNLGQRWTICPAPQDYFQCAKILRQKCPAFDSSKFSKQGKSHGGLFLVIKYRYCSYL